MLLGRKQFFFAVWTLEGFYIVQYNPFNFHVELDFNVFNAADRTKQSTRLTDA